MLENHKLLWILIFATLLGLGACGDSDTPEEKNSNELVIEPAPMMKTQGVKSSPEATANEEAVNEMDKIDAKVVELTKTGEEMTIESVVEKTESLESEVTKTGGARQLTVLAGATSFSPIVLFANPGDEVCWVNMTGHDSQSMEGLIPEGAEAWHVELGRNGCVTLPMEGVYIYKCNPHYPVGMAAAIVVGEASNMEQIDANVTGRAKGVVIKVKRALDAASGTQ